MAKLSVKEAQALVKKRSAEWTENQRQWRFLQDSLEGGNRYKHADYALDPTAMDPSGYVPWYHYGYDPATSEPIALTYKQIVDRNLTPHLSEMSEEGRDLYALRLHRTPIPTNLSRAIRCHMSRIYAREVRRDGPPALLEWWEDVDGSGVDMKKWMVDTVAPLLLALGQIDLVFDHPAAEKGVAVETRRDLIDAGLDSCVGGVILPENLLWWRLDGRTKRYAECLIFERGDEGAAFRHWTAKDSNLYDKNGQWLPERSYGHPYGIVPIRRFFDRRRVRSTNVGESQYQAVADLQRAIYNATSELILGDVQNSHALLQGPEDCLQKEATIKVGPDGVLPIVKSTNGTSVSWQGWNFLDPPKGAQAEVRLHVQDFQDEADREGALSKPAGMTATATTAQSGISKIADRQDGNDRVAAIAEVLEGTELGIAELVLTVLADGRPEPADLDALAVEYPREFELYSLSDLTEAAADIAAIAATAGALPETETELLQRIASLALPGLGEDRRTVIKEEIAAYVRSYPARQAEREREREEADEAEVVNPEPELESGPGSITLNSPMPS
jgi:hypothetical protein